MSFTRLQEAFWILGFAGHLLLLVVLLIRRRWLRFPILTSFISYQLLISTVLFLASRYGTPHTYSVAYWLCAAGDFGLQLALVVETATAICRLNGVWVHTARRTLWKWAGLGIAVAAGICLRVAPPSASGLNLWDVRATLFSSLITCELVLGVSVTANRLHLQRSRHVMAVAQGLALWAAVAVVGDALKVATGWRHELVIFDQVRMSVYLFDLGFWIFSFFRPEKVAVLSFGRLDYVAILQGRCEDLVKPPSTVGDL